VHLPLTAELTFYNCAGSALIDISANIAYLAIETWDRVPALVNAGKIVQTKGPLLGFVDALESASDDEAGAGYATCNGSGAVHFARFNSASSLEHDDAWLRQYWRRRWTWSCLLNVYDETRQDHRDQHGSQ